MTIQHYTLANMHIIIESEDEWILNTISLFLPSINNNESDHSHVNSLRYIFRQYDSSISSCYYSIRHSLTSVEHNDRYRTFCFKNCNVIYDYIDQIYYWEIPLPEEPALGVYHVNDNLCIWQTNHVKRVMSPRSFFHLFVLDIASVYMPHVQGVVLHGALGGYIRNYKTEGVAILGLSGVGKSTVLYNLAQHKTLLPCSDDTFVFSISNNSSIGHPIKTGFGLDPRLVSCDYSDLYSPLFNAKHQSGKVYYSSLPGEYSNPLAITHIFFLERSNKEYVKSISAGQALLLFLRTYTYIDSPFHLERYSLLEQFFRTAHCTQYAFTQFADSDIVASILKSD